MPISVRSPVPRSRPWGGSTASSAPRARGRDSSRFRAHGMPPVRRVRALRGLLSSRRLLIVLLVVVVLAAGLTARLFVWPATGSVQKADAVVVLAGGRGERLHKARGVMARRVAPTLVISNGHDPKWKDANRLCDTPQVFTVVCFTPVPDTTRGEAEALRTLADRQRWNRIVLVTSTYHVFRARLLVARCYSRHLAVVSAAPPRDPVRWVWALGHEWAGTIQAALHRKC